MVKAFKNLFLTGCDIEFSEELEPYANPIIMGYYLASRYIGYH